MPEMAFDDLRVYASMLTSNVIVSWHLVVLARDITPTSEDRVGLWVVGY